MPLLSIQPSPISDSSEKTRELWEKSLPYFRERSPILFISDSYRYWEPHGFVQQSLAYALAEEGIPVFWIDGAGWRPYHPTIRNPAPNLTVKQLFQFPGRRIPWIQQLSSLFGATALRHLIKSGKEPLVWIQSGLDERIAETLPYIDVFSVFDDPYRHSPTSSLCEKAKLILCQNTHAEKIFSQVHPHKTKLALPPVDMALNAFENEKSIELPYGFPEKRMGYIGSFESNGFDLVLFEDFIRSFPDWGFLLMGRTDAQGKEVLSKLGQHPNFFSIPWRPRSEVGAAWKLLTVTLLLYRPERIADGAFPTKILESLHYGVPCVATRVAKTSSLEGFFPRSSFPDELKALAQSAQQNDKTQLQKLYEYFRVEMDPRLHLAGVVQALEKGTATFPRRDLEHVRHAI